MEQRRYNDIVPCENKTEAYRAQSNHAYIYHICRSVKPCQNGLRHQLKHQNSYKHYAYRDARRQFYRVDYASAVSGSVVERYYRYYRIVQSENGHKYKRLQFKIYSEYRRSRRRESSQDFIHNEHHDGAYGRQNNRRNAYREYSSYYLAAGAEAF